MDTRAHLRKRARWEVESPQPGHSLWHRQDRPPWDWLGFFQTVPKDIGTPSGDTLNAALLRLLQLQALAACCRAALEWCTIDGRRVLLRLNEECRRGGPFAPPDRMDATHVDAVSLGRYGRQTPEQYVRVIAKCSRTRALRCVYSKLTGMGVQLKPLPPCLSLRQVKLHQCRLEADDLVQLLRYSPNMEAIDVHTENLAGLGELLGSVALRGTEMRSIEFVNCGLVAQDAAALVAVFSKNLCTASFQGNNLQGLRAKLPTLQTLDLVDCSLSWEDAAAMSSNCPLLEVLRLCGNPLGGGAFSTPWPAMPRLRVGDFRHCGMDSDDEAELRACLQGCGKLEFRSPPAQRIVFASSDSEDRQEGE